MAVLILGPGSTNTALDRLRGPTLVNDSGSRLNGIHAINESDRPVFLQVFNEAKVGDVTLGKTIPNDIVALPPANEFGLAGSKGENYGLNAPNYGKGIVIAATHSSHGGDRVQAGDVFANVKYTPVG